VDAVGPDLRFATAQVTKTTAGRGHYADEFASDEGWESATRQRPTAPLAAVA